MKNSIILAGASALLALGISTTFASIAAPIYHGVYLEGNVGYGWVNKIRSKNFSKSKFSPNIGKGFAWNVNGGYKINENVGVELGYTKYHSQKYHLKTNHSATINGRKSYTFDLAAKGIIPLQQGFSVFGKIGPAYAHQTRKESIVSKCSHKVVPYGAVGVGYAATPNLTANVQLAGTTKSGDVPARWATTVGLNYLI